MHPQSFYIEEDEAEEPHLLTQQYKTHRLMLYGATQSSRRRHFELTHILFANFILGCGGELIIDSILYTCVRVYIYTVMWCSFSDTLSQFYRNVLPLKSLEIAVISDSIKEMYVLNWWFGPTLNVFFCDRHQFWLLYKKEVVRCLRLLFYKYTIQ